ncbi:MAG: hypothetical protein JNM34_01975 [Chthonomonadaceae bacterium]|nr:hypothetical protein [Chthonomonadaceae bacterium]
MVQYKRVGEMLLEQGLISDTQLQHALKVKLESSLRFGEILTSLNYVSEDEVTQCLAEQYGYPVADLTRLTPEPEAVALVPSMTALSGLVLPVKLTSERFYCVIADPLDVPTTDAVLRMVGRPVEISLANPTELFDLIVQTYRLGPRVKQAKAPVVPAPKSDDVMVAKKPAKPRQKRPVKIDPQDDRFALLAALSGVAA